MANTEGQVAGSIVALLICVVIYLISLLFPFSPQAAGFIPFLTGNSSSVAIELTGDCINDRGIYIVPQGTKVADFLRGMKGELAFECDSEPILFSLMQHRPATAEYLYALWIEDSFHFSMGRVRLSDKPSEITLLAGHSLLVSRSKGVSPLFILKEMDAARKIALGLPIDINRASGDDFKLIPGIGDKTASQIISLRESYGMITHLDELIKIKGIKEKRLAQLRKYLYVDKRRGE
jgi:hypothetical protein